MTLGVSLLAAAMIAGAVTKPESPGGKADFSQASMVDARVNLRSSYLSASQASGATAGRQALASQHALDIGRAIDSWRSTMPSLDVERSNLTGAPSSVRNAQGALTAAAPGQSNEAVVRSFLLQRGAIYGRMRLMRTISRSWVTAPVRAEACACCAPNRWSPVAPYSSRRRASRWTGKVAS